MVHLVHRERFHTSFVLFRMTIAALVHLLVVLVIIGAVLYIVWWAIRDIPAPEPIKVVIRVVFALVVALIAIELILPLAGTSLGVR